jgi:hypothetical protein
VQDTQLFIPLRARFSPDLPWALLAEALALQSGIYTFLAPDFRLDVSRDHFAPLSRALTAAPGRPHVTLELRPSTDLPALRFTPPEQPTTPSPAGPAEAAERQPIERQPITEEEKAGWLQRIFGGEQPPPEIVSTISDEERAGEQVVIREVEPQDVTAQLRAQAESCREDGKYLDAALYFALAGEMAAAGQSYQRGAHNVTPTGGDEQ